MCNVLDSYNDTDAEVDSSGQGCRGVAEGEMVNALTILVVNVAVYT